MSNVRHSIVANILFWIGVAIAALGAILLSPIADLLPVGFWASLKNHFQSDGSQFMRVVPTENDSSFTYILIGLGIVLVIVSYIFKASK